MAPSDGPNLQMAKVVLLGCQISLFSKLCVLVAAETQDICCFRVSDQDQDERNLTGKVNMGGN